MCQSTYCPPLPWVMHTLPPTTQKGHVCTVHVQWEVVFINSYCAKVCLTVTAQHEMLVTQTLEAVETLGSISVIFMNKTGTLTGNKIHVRADELSWIIPPCSPPPSSSHSSLFPTPTPILHPLACLLRLGSPCKGHGSLRQSSVSREPRSHCSQGEVTPEPKPLCNTHVFLSERDDGCCFHHGMGWTTLFCGCLTLWACVGRLYNSDASELALLSYFLTVNMEL